MRAAAALFLALCASAVARAAPGDELGARSRAVLSSPSPQPGDGAGLAVALSSDGRRALIGVPYDDGAGEGAGAALVYARSSTGGWTLEDVLRPSRGLAQAGFGRAVALSANGERAVIGAPQETVEGFRSAGAVWVFDRSSDGRWRERQRLTSRRPNGGDLFGRSVALTRGGSRLAVGIPEEDVFGSVEIFEQRGETWRNQAEIEVQSLNLGARFGASLAFDASGGTLLVGAPGNYRVDGGAVLLREGAGGRWRPQAFLRRAFDRSSLGQSVALSPDGRRALLGGPSATRFDSSHAVLFEEAGGAWREAARFLPDDPTGYFGDAVAMSPDAERVFIGAPGENTASGQAAGTVYVWERAPARGWLRIATFELSSHPFANLGTALASGPSGAQLLVGMAGDELEGERVGSARWVELVSPPLGLGERCLHDSTCASGLCVDGVCCDGPCAAQCESCRELGSGGRCAARAGAPVGDRERCRGQDACLGTCAGPRDRCVHPGRDVTCAEPQCWSASGVSGEDVAEAFCDGRGNCSRPPRVGCAPYTCGPAACKTSCASEEDCAAGLDCLDGACIQLLELGERCSSAAACASRFCVDGICCATSCARPCETCALPERSGLCSDISACPPACESDVDCGDAMICEAGLCAEPPRPLEPSSCRCRGGRRPSSPWGVLLGLGALLVGRYRRTWRRPEDR